MGLFTHLVGGIEVRERRPRSEDEPYRHRKLEFVRPKTTTTSDDWSLVRTTYPRPRARTYGHPWEHPQWNSLSYQQQQELLFRGGYYQPPPPFQPGGDGHGGPPPPPSHGPQHLGGPSHDQHRIKMPEIVPLTPSHHSDEDEDDDKIVEIIKPRKSSKKGRTTKYVHTGQSIFDSDSEDDLRRVRRRGGALSTISSSSSGSSISRRRGGRTGHKGW